MPQLDGLRAFAVTMVFYCHFSAYLPDYLPNFIHWGRLGVILFFVLSGFLITGILLRERRFKDQAGTSALSHFRSFYLRRALRIFPVYYLTVFALAFFQYKPVISYLPIHLAYASNLTGFFGKTDYGYVTHFWSLCVEEQFYLLWPFLIFYIPQRLMPRIIIALILAGPFYKILCLAYGFGWGPATRTPLGCIESLGCGALLAYYRHTHAHQTMEQLKHWGLVLALPVLLTLQILRPTLELSPIGRVSYVSLIDASASLAFCPLLLRACGGASGLWGKILTNPILRYIGKISYGLYIYHLIPKIACQPLLQALNIAPPRPGVVMFVLYWLAAVGIASASWFFIEKPVTRFKNKIPYFSAFRE